MYRITFPSGIFVVTEVPNWVLVHPDDPNCFVPCSREQAEGVAYKGNPTLFRDGVTVAEIDGGDEIGALHKQGDSTAKLASSTAAMSTQTATAARVMMRDATTVTDAEALMMPDLFRTWAEALAAGAQLMAETVLNKDGKLYRVVQAVTPIETQPPDGEGMLAIYRPIDVVHTGEMDDPIPWEYGMDCEEGKYYSYEDGLWLCTSDMKPCVWAPGTAGVWQWQEVTD